nr:prepilin peptidase [Vibrio cyclitrophicus]
MKNNSLLSLLIFQLVCTLALMNPCILSASIVLTLGMVIYSYNVIGAGDIKYAAVLSLSLPVELLLNAVLLTMLTGGVLATFYMLLNLARRIKANVYGEIDQSQYNTGIPYGVAISVGFYVMIFSHWVNYI